MVLEFRTKIRLIIDNEYGANIRVTFGLGIENEELSDSLFLQRK